MPEKAEKTERKAVATWNPFAELDLLREWRPFEGGLGGRLTRLLHEIEGGRGRAHQPAVDIDENDKSYTLSVELPGVKKDDVSVELENGILTIHGEKKSEREEKKGSSRWVERSFGSFHRSFTLPANAVSDRVEATFKDGVLVVTIPKVESPKPKVIAIKA
ncbi:MAG TPA: Hsp20/alpha crystallin family protein [Myxococcota bacterium]|jgi:HSP20 family protein|nr:Hsp20/alpha crystallin family protein [Myxococcota bacterium]